MSLFLQVTDEVNGAKCCVLLMWMSCAGNDNLHLLTMSVRQILRIDLVDWEGNKRYAEYDNFRVGTEADKYTLISLGKYSGDAGQ